MVDFVLKQGDTSPSLAITLMDAAGNPVDLTGASVRFHMKPIDSPTVKIDATATVTDAANGKVRYDWQTGDSDTLGFFQGEFEVTFSDGTVGSFPSDSSASFIIIQVSKDIA